MEVTKYILLSLSMTFFVVDVSGEKSFGEIIFEDCEQLHLLDNQCPDILEGIECLESGEYIASKEDSENLKKTIASKLSDLTQRKAECPAMAEQGRCLFDEWNSCTNDFNSLQSVKGYIESCRVLLKTIDCLKNLKSLCRSKNGSALYTEVSLLLDDQDKCDLGYFKDFLPLDGCRNKTQACVGELKNTLESENTDGLRKEDIAPHQPSTEKCMQLDEFRPQCEYRELQGDYRSVEEMQKRVEFDEGCIYNVQQCTEQWKKENGTYDCGEKMNDVQKCLGNYVQECSHSKRILYLIAVVNTEMSVACGEMDP